MANLFETYKVQLQVADNLHKKMNEGEGLSVTKKTALARCLDNITGLMENYSHTAPGEITQRSGMGDFKKFCVNITSIALPELIAFDLVHVHPMDSITGNIAFPKYMYSVTKGDIKSGDEFNSFKKLGKFDSHYTSEAVVETIAAAASTYVCAWGPVVKGVFKDATGAAKDVKVVKADGTEVFADVAGDGKTVTVDLVAGDRVAYKYQNELVPQSQIPGIKMEMVNIPLYAHARRISIAWDLLAEFQA